MLHLESLGAYGVTPYIALQLHRLPPGLRPSIFFAADAGPLRAQNSNAAKIVDSWALELGQM